MVMDDELTLWMSIVPVDEGNVVGRIILLLLTARSILSREVWLMIIS